MKKQDLYPDYIVGQKLYWVCLETEQVVAETIVKTSSRYIYTENEWEEENKYTYHECWNQFCIDRKDAEEELFLHKERLLPKNQRKVTLSLTNEDLNHLDSVARFIEDETVHYVISSILEQS